MAEKKKLSVAEILAAARKTDAGKSSDAGAVAPEAAPAAPVEKAPVEKTPAAEAPVASEAAPAAPKPAAKPGGPRLSVAEMMAAARAEKAGGAPAPAAPKPAAASKPAAAPVAKKEPAAKPAAKEPVAAVAAAPKDTGSILAAARNPNQPGPLSKAEAAAKAPAKPAARPEKPKLVVPSMPAKPEYARPKPAPAVVEDRRGFMTTVMLGSFLGIGFTALSTTLTLWTLGVARFMFPNVLMEPPSKFKVGFPSNFAPGQVETKFIPQFGVWIVNYEYNGKSEIYALRSVCTHLGCTPNWLEGEQKFKCPCHGSGFYKDGINFEGPAPRPLERYAIRLADDGQLEVDKSKLFQEEIGQWSDPASYVAV